MADESPYCFRIDLVQQTNKDGQCIQTLQQPCISVWTIDVLPNDDIVVGGSDAAVRTYTRHSERMASEENLKVLKKKEEGGMRTKGIVWANSVWFVNRHLRNC